MLGVEHMAVSSFPIQGSTSWADTGSAGVVNGGEASGPVTPEGQAHQTPPPYLAWRAGQRGGALPGSSCRIAYLPIQAPLQWS